MNKPTLLLDFDDTLHYYHPREFSAHLGPPIANARRACFILAKCFRLICFTSRPQEMVERWLRSNGFPQMMVTNIKQPGLLVDDRAVTFNGKWTDTFIQQLHNFSPYWQHGTDLEGDEPVQDKVTCCICGSEFVQGIGAVGTDYKFCSYPCYEKYLKEGSPLQMQEVMGHQSAEETDDGDSTTPVSDPTLDES